jgi:cytochrome c-type biogenesis protein CcmF
MPVLGKILLGLALATSAAAVLLYARSRPSSAAEKIARFLVRLHVVAVVLASAVLLTLLLTHDFSVGYVYSYSDRALSLELLISSFYAGQEGSFLFWALCAAMVAPFLTRSTAKKGSEGAVMAVFMTVQTLLVLLLMVKSPFRMIWESFSGVPAGTIPPDGRGLNPLLQNFWMVIHPPVLFIGFALMAVPFSYAVAGLWRKRDDILVTQAIPWVLTAVTFLGAGIMLGGYWAYGVLGWGGYWAWDPVENASLVPWLTGMGLVHTLLAQLRTGKFRRTNFILAIVSFILVVYSTFLTRSGILGDASVHSFTDPGSTVYGVLLLFLFSMILMGTIGVVLRWKALRPAESGSEFLTREHALAWGALVLILSAVVVSFGTSLPMLGERTVERSFYDQTHVPIAVVLTLLIGFSLYTQWEMQDLREVLRRSWRPFAAALVLTGAVALAGVRDATALLLIFGAAFAVVVNLAIAIQVAKGDWRFLGGKIAHIGVAVFIAGVVGSGIYSATEQVTLPQGEPRPVLGQLLTYQGARQLPDGKWAFDVKLQSGGASYSLAPVMFETGEQGVMKNPDIATFVTRDVYLSPIAVQEGRSGGGESFTLAKGAVTEVGGARVTFTGFDMSGHSMEGGGDGMVIGARLELLSGKETERLVPATLFRGGQPAQQQAVHSAILGGDLRLVAMSVGMESLPSTVTLELARSGEQPVRSEALILDASVKPYINLVWAGTVLMLAGFVLSILKRAKEQ